MLAHDLMTAWQRMLTPQATTFRLPTDRRAAIHCYDPIDEFTAWSRCRDRAQFHLGRARRAKDRGHYRAAAREIERALRYDDTSEAYFQVLGQCHFHGSPRDLPAARAAFERAFALNPRNGYTIKLLLQVCEASGNTVAAKNTLERALAAGAPPAVWRAALDRYQTPERVALSA